LKSSWRFCDSEAFAVKGVVVPFLSRANGWANAIDHEVYHRKKELRQIVSQAFFSTPPAVGVDSVAAMIRLDEVPHAPKFPAPIAKVKATNVITTALNLRYSALETSRSTNNKNLQDQG
jgi:hypothetical protein